MGQFDSVKIGVCDVYWTPHGKNPQTDEIFLGLTKGGVELRYEPTFYDITVDQYGETPIDSVLIGESVIATIPLAETDIEKLKLFSPTGTVVENTTSGKSKLTFGQKPGLRLSDTAGRLRLHPIAFDDQSEDVIIYKAVCKAPLQLNYRVNEERIYSIEFHGMIDKNREDGDMLWQIGDPTTSE